MSEYLVLAVNIKRIRKRLGMSQLDFALECDISLKILYLIECGETNPKLSTLIKIAKYCEIDVGDLLCENAETKLNIDSILKKSLIEM